MYGIHSILIDGPFLAVLSYLSAGDMLKAILGRVNKEHENYLPGNFTTITAFIIEIECRQSSLSMTIIWERIYWILACQTVDVIIR